MAKKANKRKQEAKTFPIHGVITTDHGSGIVGQSAVSGSLVMWPSGMITVKLDKAHLKGDYDVSVFASFLPWSPDSVVSE